MDRPCLKTAHYNIGTLEQYAIVAQLTRASDSYPEGRWFDSNLWYQAEIRQDCFYLRFANRKIHKKIFSKLLKNF